MFYKNWHKLSELTCKEHGRHVSPSKNHVVPYAIKFCERLNKKTSVPYDKMRRVFGGSTKSCGTCFLSNTTFKDAQESSKLQGGEASASNSPDCDNNQ